MSGERTTGGEIVTDPFIGQTLVTMVADPSTPEAIKIAYAGKTFMARPGDLDKLGSGADNPGKVLGIRGYPITNPDGSVQFVMLGPVSGTDLQAIKDIPGGLGWVAPAAFNAYQQIAQMLLDAGVSVPVVKLAITTAYRAAEVNVNKQHQMAPA